MTQDINTMTRSSRFARHLLRYAVLLLMMVMGVSDMWGQDYSGVYYIANKIWNGNHDQSTEEGYEDYFYSVDKPDKNWYLVPAADPHQTNYEDAYYSGDEYATPGDENRPFLTTYRTNRDYNSIWIVKKTGTKYYLIHALTGKYVKYEPPISNVAKRRSMHLEAVDTDTPGNVFKYTFTTNTKNGITGFNIKPTQSNGNNVSGYFNPAGDNWPYYYAATQHTTEHTWVVGLVGFYNNTDGGSLWPWEDAKAALTPTINVNAELGSFTIIPPVATYVNPEDVSSTITKPAGFLPPGCSIRYTTGDGTQDAPTANTGDEYVVGTPIDITDFTNVKAAIFGYGMQLGFLSNAMLNQTITLSQSSYEYNGSAIEPTVTLKYGDNTIPAEEYEVTYTDNTNAGTATVTVTDKAGGNFYVITATEQFTINPASVILIGNSRDTDIYDGTEKTVSGFTCSVDGLNFTGVSASGSGTNAGTYDVTFSGVTVNTTRDDTNNYVVTEVTNGVLTINPASVTLTANSRGTDVYDGTEKTVTGFTSSVDGLTFTGISASGSGTNAGTYDVTFSGVTVNTTKDDTGNYLVTGTTNGTLTINRKGVTITANDATKEYDGSALTEAGFTTTDLEDGDTHTFTITMTAESTITNKGTQPNVIATVDGAAVTTGTEIAIGNYLVTTVNGTLSVTGRVITITAGSDSKVYDGTALTNNDYTYEGTLYSGDEITSVTITGSQTVAGSSDNVPSAAVIKNGEADRTANYDVTYVIGTLTVTAKALTITAGSDSKVYDGTALTNNTYTNTNLATDDAIESVTVTGSQTVVGTSNNVPSEAVIKNAGNDDVTASYNITYANGTLEVTQKALTITAGSDTKAYDGTALTKDTYTNTALATGDAIESVTVTGSQTVVGTSDNVPSEAVIKNAGNDDVTASYNITYANGTLEVTQKSIGDGTLATGFSIDFDEDDNIILYEGTTELNSTDYSVGDKETSASGRYSTRTINGQGNYGGYVIIRDAIVTFATNNQKEWSATFVAENATDPANPVSSQGHKLPDGITAYIITSIDGNWAIPEALNYIPEGVPVLLLSDKESNGFFVKDAESVTEITNAQKTANMLEEVKAGMAGYVTDAESSNYQKAHFNTKTIYLLHNNEFVYNMEGYLGKGKVYLNPNHPTDPSTTGSGSGGNSRLWIKWDATSGIDNTQLSTPTTHLSDVWYALDGRRLNGKPSAKGLYIVNGKKMIVK